jgi:ABC-type antimicrobial peptide transport system permease subunit
MFKSYIVIAWRNLVKNKFSSVINIGGLAVGMAVAMLIGFWIWDEVSFNKDFQNYDRIARVMKNQTISNQIQTWNGQAYPLGDELRNHYGSNFKHVIMTAYTAGRILTVGEKHLKISGNYMEPGITDMLSLEMIKGTREGLKDPASILLSESSAKDLFGDADPMGKPVKIDNKLDVVVTGVYKDLPLNSSFSDLHYIAPWQLIVNAEHYDTRFNNPWGASWFLTLVQIADHVDMNLASAKIRDAELNQIRNNADVRFKPLLFLHPMSRWHLYSQFDNGVNTGGAIQYVWLFGIIGVFVLLLACINFMNLSTARSEKRAKEVSIRKSVGSLRKQLILQFYIESGMISLLSFIIALALVQLIMPFFNDFSGKNMHVLWTNPVFWIIGLGFSLITGLIAGSYPALYLSSFNPVKVLKGGFRVGRLAAIPRRALVVMQFSVSVILIVGTIVVFQQIQFAKDRPVGYIRNSLVTIPLQTEAIHQQYDAVRNELYKTGVTSHVSESEIPITAIYNTNMGFKWKGKDPQLQEEFTSMSIGPDFGKTVGWQIIEGRDFDPSNLNDSTGFVVNEAAVKYMGMKNPIGETVEWIGNDKYHIIGVVKNMVTSSPYDPAKQTLFYWIPRWGHMNNLNVRIDSGVSMHHALAKISAVIKKFDPSSPFIYQFADEEYAKKFTNEERIGKLASAFACLAIFISCLGLFGMASFTAEKRIKEIGIRKVLGASVFNLWRLLSREFVSLVIISFLISVPLSWFLMHKWLMNFEYRSEINGWIFLMTALGTIFITLMTVSYQSIRAALMNPVNSLRAE